MQTIRRGSMGADVKLWQSDVLHITADGVFGPYTEAETMAWQRRHGLTADGVVGSKTWAAADIVRAVIDTTVPPRPAFGPLTLAQRNQLFGAFEWEPIENGNGAIDIRGNWVRENIVTIHVPQLAGVEGTNAKGSVTCHKLIADRLLEFFAAVERAGLASRILSFGGCWVPRFIRGYSGVLSNHAHGTAVDINVRWNFLGNKPAAYGAEGCLLELVHIAQSLGLYWGGHFGRADGMHFEAAQLDLAA